MQQDETKDCQSFIDLFHEPSQIEVVWGLFGFVVGFFFTHTCRNKVTKSFFSPAHIQLSAQQPTLYLIDNAFSYFRNFQNTFSLNPGLNEYLTVTAIKWLETLYVLSNQNFFERYKTPLS